MIILISSSISILVGYFLGFQWAKHFSISGILWNLHNRGVLYFAKFVNNDVYNHNYDPSKYEKYFLTLNAANKWASKMFMKSKKKYPEMRGSLIAWIDCKGKTVAEFFC